MIHSLISLTFGKENITKTLLHNNLLRFQQAMALEYILNSPIGIAALNQLAIKRFISPVCRKTFYVNDRTGGFQTLLRVKCPDARGVSIGMGYDEIRVIFNRFEDNIESFEVKRVYPGRPVTPSLPE